ncbi:MAG: acyl-CoA thioesterase [Gammaproteobacteria bacterium]|nr:acyl-CoA thioesterase [Gammaproteobacteria bacterium]
MTDTTPAIDKDNTRVALRTMAMPADTNFNGDIFGGWILSQMDLAAGTYAYSVAKGRVATVAITGMKFHKPVSVGDEISCYCVTEKIGTTSITVLVEAWVRRRQKALEEKVTEGLFTFVAIDPNGKPRPVDQADPNFAAPPIELSKNSKSGSS